MVGAAAAGFECGAKLVSREHSVQPKNQADIRSAGSVSDHRCEPAGSGGSLESCAGAVYRHGGIQHRKHYPDCLAGMAQQGNDGEDLDWKR